MSDHEHDDHTDHESGAHEVDKMPSGRLFNLLFGLSALTLVACFGVVQLFHSQAESIKARRDAQVSFQLAEYRQEMEEIKNGGILFINDDDGVPSTEGGKGPHEARRYHMPLTEARKRMLEESARYMKAERPYRGWRNPDANAPKVEAPKRGAGRPGRGRMPGRPGGAQLPRGVVPTKGGAAAPPPRGGGVPVRPGTAPKPAEGKAPPKPAEGKAPPKPAEGKAPN